MYWKEMAARLYYGTGLCRKYEARHLKLFVPQLRGQVLPSWASGKE